MQENLQQGGHSVKEQMQEIEEAEKMWQEKRC